MQMPVEDLTKQILSRRIGKQDAMRLFRSLDHQSQLQVLSIVRGADGLATAHGGDGEPGTLVPVAPRDLTDAHRAWIEDLAGRYARFAPTSRARAREYPSAAVGRDASAGEVSGQFPFAIVHARAEGAHLHDIDGNRYVDVSRELGASIFGHRPAFLIEAIRTGLEQGGPLSGHGEATLRASALFCEATGHERVLFAASGAEAAMAAIRMARDATGRGKVVVFGDGHGALPPALAGLLRAADDDVIVLAHGDTAALDTIERHAGEIAAVAVEPGVPAHRDAGSDDFLKALRRLTLEQGIALVFDETSTAFRSCRRDAQAASGVRPDLAVHAAIPGGGLAAGILAGPAKWLDRVDRGDAASAGQGPSTGLLPQNALQIAATVAALETLKARCGDGADGCGSGHCAQRAVADRTSRLATTLDAFFAAERLPARIAASGPSFRLQLVGDDSGDSVAAALLPILLRLEGVEIGRQGGCVLTQAHTDAEVDAVIAGIQSAMSLLKHNGLFHVPVAAPAQDAAPQPQAIVASRSPRTRDTTPRNDIERLKALIAADLASAEESGHSR